MRIAINIGGFLLKDKGWSDMVETLFRYMAKVWPQHQFVFIIDDIQKVTTSPNITGIVLSNPLNNRLSLKFWYDYKLSSILKKNKIDVLVNPDGICTIRSHVPQIVFVKDFALQSSTKTKSNGFIKKRFQKSLVKANAIVVFSPVDQIKLLDKFPLAEQKIVVANLFADMVFQPKDWQEKEQVKDKYSEGKEYFLFKMDEKNPINLLILLKAFSLFKKRQQSNMQLLLIGATGKATDNLAEKMATYKYRNEVKMLNLSTTAEVVDVLASAYALLHFSDAAIDLPLLNAMQTGVPAIVLKNDFSFEIVSDIVLHADVKNPESIAEQMKIIYKDENLRSRMVAAGLALAQNNTVEKTTTQIWSAISKTQENG